MPTRLRIDVLSSAETLPAQVGAVYGLYLLYFTQPKNFKKVAIRLTIAAWQNLELLYKLGFDYSATDLIFIIHKLRDRGAFMYVAQNEKISKALMNENDDLSERAERTLVRLEREMNNSVLVPVDGPLKQFSELATEYHNAKVELIDVSLAKRASEMVMAHLCRIKPPDLDLATAKPRPAFLREKHAPTSPSPTQFKAGSTTGRFVDTDGDNAREATATSNTDIEMTEASSSSREPLTGPTPASSVRAVASSSSVSRRQGPGPRQPYTRPHVSQTESNPDDGKVTRKREMSKKKKRILPNVFPLSMLQASTPYFADQIDDVVRRYFKDRLSRFEFAVGDGLSRNDYKFPTQPLSKRRGRAFPITSGLELELEIHGIRNIQEPDERDMRLLEVMKNRRKQIAERRKGKKTSSNTAGSGTDKGANTDTDEHDVEHPVEGAGERDQVHGLELRGTKSPECDAEGNSLDKRERDAESTNLDERERGDEHKLD
ncbi:hypothetical protein BGZ54_006194 [Gamsiella multidivaricata]|nr:hypothetical protein BGZ54_006194 [Gamsiella multidivaricata]